MRRQIFERKLMFQFWGAYRRVEDYKPRDVIIVFYVNYCQKKSTDNNENKLHGFYKNSVQYIFTKCLKRRKPMWS